MLRNVLPPGTSTRRRYPGPKSWLAERDGAAYRLLRDADNSRGTSSAGGLAGRRAELSAPSPVPWRDAVPSGRIGYRPDDPVVLCHSFLTQTAYQQLQLDGRVGPERGHTTGCVHGEDQFAAAYDWMRWQMAQRINGYTGRYPMWVWARLPRAEVLAEARRVASDAAGSVLITLMIPREHVLLTDFLEWHTVLNGQSSPPLNCPRCRTRHCDDPTCLDIWFDRWSADWDERALRAGVTPGDGWWTWPEPIGTEVLESWQNIFHTPRRRPLQGCVEYLHASWVHAAVIPTR